MDEERFFRAVGQLLGVSCLTLAVVAPAASAVFLAWRWLGPRSRKE